MAPILFSLYFSLMRLPKKRVQGLSLGSTLLLAYTIIPALQGKSKNKNVNNNKRFVVLFAGDVVFGVTSLQRAHLVDLL